MSSHPMKLDYCSDVALVLATPLNKIDSLLLKVTIHWTSVNGKLFVQVKRISEKFSSMSCSNLGKHLPIPQKCDECEFLL